MHDSHRQMLLLLVLLLQFVTRIAAVDNTDRSLGHERVAFMNALRPAGFARRAPQGSPMIRAALRQEPKSPLFESNTICPKKSGRVCNGEGICVGGEANQAKRCICYDGFFGVACHLKHCPGWRPKTGGGRAFKTRGVVANRKIHHEGDGFDGGFASASDFEECSSHGKCHHEEVLLSRPGLDSDTWNEDRKAAGSCECVWPYIGTDCSLFICPNFEGKTCNNQGTCEIPGHGTDAGTRDGLQGRCVCKWPFFGNACEQAHCPNPMLKVMTAQPSRRQTIDQTDYIECQGHGTCHHGTGSESMWTRAVGGSYFVQPTAAGHAASQWQRGSWGRCECDVGFHSADCSLQVCPSYKGQECNGQGTCVSKQCVTNSGTNQQCKGYAAQDGGRARCDCIFPYFGEKCHLKHCPGAQFLDLGNRWRDGGSMLDRERGATRGSGFLAGESDGVLQNWKHCSSHGICHFEDSEESSPTSSITSAGTCECEPGWESMSDCSQRQCPVNDGRVCNGQGVCDSTSQAEQVQPGTQQGSLRGIHRPAAGRPESRGLSDWAGVMHATRPLIPGGGSAYMVGDGQTKPGTCRCSFPYFNGPKEACELKFCPGTKIQVVGRVPTRTLHASDYIVCSGHGECLHSDPAVHHAASSPTESAHSAIRHPSGDKAERVREVRDGWCDCSPGWFGPDCAQRLCPVFNGTECNNQGSCDRQTGRCECRGRFFGNDCSWRHCDGFLMKHAARSMKRPVLGHSDFYECHAGTKLTRGTCNYDTGECYCLDQFYGTQCEFVRCPQHNGVDCNGQGNCEVHTAAHGEGQAAEQWSGPDHGRSGVTETGYSDHVDEETEPTLKTYKGFGKCSCNDGHEGTACEHKKCPTFQTHVCAGHGHCDQDTGRCHCETDYFGYDCSAGNGMNTDLGVEL